MNLHLYYNRLYNLLKITFLSGKQMNVNFNGLIHITGPHAKVSKKIKELSEDCKGNQVYSTVVNGPNADVFMLTQKDACEYTEKKLTHRIHDDERETLLPSDPNECFNLSRIITKHLAFHQLIKEFFEEKTAKGAKIETIKL